MKFFVVCFALVGVLGGSFAETSEPSVAQLPGPLPCFGCPQPISDEQKLADLKQTLSKHLHKLDGQANGGNLTLVTIYSATSQVVAGAAYNLYAELKENEVNVNCSVKLWERLWLDFVKLDLECGAENRKYAYETPLNAAENAESSQKAKRQVPGGYQNLSPDGLNELLPKLAAIFDKLSSQYEDFDVKLERVSGGRYQMVAGKHYIVNVETTQKGNGNAQQCEADIFENFKLEFETVKVECGHTKKEFLYEKH